MRRDVSPGCCRASDGSTNPPPAPVGGDRERAWGIYQMVMWPALTLIGFVLLTAFVVALGMQSTARYEREQRGEVGPASARQAAGEPVGATTA
jgi:hypothetical protein